MSSPSSDPLSSPNFSVPPFNNEFPSDYDWNDNLPAMYAGSRKGAKQWQEDSFFSFQSPNRVVRVGGVFDGHGGYNGLIASNRARDFCKSYLNHHKAELEHWTVNEWQNKLKLLFQGAHQAIRNRFLQEGGDNSRVTDDKGIVRTGSGDPVHGGTTCSMVVMVAEPKSSEGRCATLITANVGDSTCVLIPQRGRWEFLSVDHGPENPDEFARVQSLDIPTKLMFVYDKTNIFRKYECPLVFKPDGTKDQIYVANPWGHGLHPTNVRYEPAVYAVTPRSVSKDSTCIAMTRALGDFYAHQFGLSAEPAIGVKRIRIESGDSEHKAADGEEPQDSFAPSTTLSVSSEFTIVLASDGIWDCWKYEEFAQFMVDEQYKKGRSIAESSEAVLEESITRAISNFGAKHFDDACIVGWKFQLD